MAAKLMVIPKSFSHAGEILAGKQSRKIANNTWLEYRHDRFGEAFALRYHSTDIVTYSHDGSVSFSTGGWKTVTTKARLDQVLTTFGYGLCSHKKQWLVFCRLFKSVAVPYADNLTLSEIIEKSSPKSSVGTETDYGNPHACGGEY